MISVKDLKKTYGRGTRFKEEVLHGVSFDLPETGFVCILGRSGSGKTSLLNAIGGLDVFDSGTLEIDGKTLSNSSSREMEKQRNANFGYVFQNYYLLSEHSAAYNVYLGLNSLDLNEEEKLKRVAEALEKVGMLRFRKRLVGELSGGQQQRIAIARALAKSPRVIFADEPTGNLDEESTLNICSLLKKLSKTSLVVMVTHEERLANFFADRIIRIEDGRIGSDEAGWERGSLVSADKNTVYEADYKEQTISSDKLNIRVLAAEDTDPADITLIVENGRLLIKTDDSRLVMYSKQSEPPFIKKGHRPVLELKELDDAAPDAAFADRPKLKKRSRSGLGLRMLFAELKTTASKKKLRNAATGLFIVLLSIMLLLSISDIAAAAKIKPEDFITADSHVLELSFDKGPNFEDRSALSVAEYVPECLKLLDEKGFDIDYIPDTNLPFQFYCDVMPQYGMLSMSLGKYNIADIERLDASKIVYGRMPERFDEIVVDRWVIKKCTSTDGIVQNLIPDNEYMIGKRLVIGEKHYWPTIVGICDSGEPSVYMNKAGMLSVGIRGMEAMPYSEFISVTGRTDVAPLAPGECAIISQNSGDYYKKRIGQKVAMPNGLLLYFRELVENTDHDHEIYAPMIIADEDVDDFLRFAIEGVTHFDLWCADKAAVKRALSEPLSKELDGVVRIDVGDIYGREHASFMAKRSVRLQTRFIITAAAGLLCLVMLYVIQRFRVRDRMSMIAVYRMLGIPGRDSAAVFILENVLLALKYALPAIFLTWAVITVLPMLGVGGLSITIPLWVPFAALAVIIAAEIAVALIATARLLKMPPAKLAAKYDF